MTAFERAARALIASRRSPGTRKLYTGDLDLWLAFCRAGKVNAVDVPIEAATAHRDALQARYKPLTVRRVLAALSKMYKAAVGSRVAAWNPFDGEALPRPPADSFVRTEAVSDETAKAIIAAASDSPRDAALLCILYDTGIRRAEVARLKRENVIEREDRLVVGFHGKGGKWHEATLPPQTGAKLSAWMLDCPHEYVFPNRSKTGPINVATVNKIVTRYMKLSGTADHVHPHQFRAAFATEALDHHPLQDVQAAMGHADPRMTLRYDRRKRGAGVSDRVAEERGKK